MLGYTSGVCLSLDRTGRRQKITIFYTNGYESILTENWRSRDVSNKDLLGGRQFLGINNENKKKRTIWSLQHHKQHYICRVEEEYACDLVYLPRLPLYKLDGYERFEELVRHDQRIFINSDICMSIRRLEIRINANTDVPKGWYSRLTILQKLSWKCRQLTCQLKGPNDMSY